VSFSICAAEAILPETEAMDTLESLVNKSLIKTEGDDQETRFSMLRLIREFGQKELAKMPDEQTLAQNRYIEYYLNYLHHETADINKTSISDWMAEIEKEIDNIRQVISLLVKSPSDELRAFVLQHWRYYLLAGFLQEGYEVTLQAIESGADKMDELQGKLLIAAGTFAQNLGSYKKAKQLFSDALQIFHTISADLLTCTTLNNLAWVEFRLGGYNRSNSFSQDALGIALEHSNHKLQAGALNNLAWVAMFRGLTSQASNLYKQVEEIYQKIGDERGQAFCATNQAWTLVRLERSEEARALIGKATATFGKIGDRQLLAFANAIKSLILEDPSYILLQEVIPIFKEIGDSWGIGIAYQFLSEYALRKEDLAAAKSYIHHSLKIRTKIDDRWGICSSHLIHGSILYAQGNFFESQRNLNQALFLADQMDTPGLLCHILAKQAWINFRMKTIPESRAKLDAAIAQATRLGESEWHLFRRKYEELMQSLGVNSEVRTLK
jgi:tetratricopeptide (TPR) repeat protein